MVELDVKIEVGDLYDYMLMHAYHGAAGLLGSGVGAVAVRVGASKGEIIFLIAGLILLLYLPWNLFVQSSRQVVNNPAFQEPLHYTLDEEGLTISQGEEQAQMAWEDMYKAVSTGRSIILYTSRVNATLFPKRQLGEQREAVIQMISTHMPPAKVKIRS